MTTIDLDDLEHALLGDIAAAADEAAIEAVRIGALGKKGLISDRLKTLGSMSAEERQVMGPAINGLKQRVNDALCPMFNPARFESSAKSS